MKKTCAVVYSFILAAILVVGVGCAKKLDDAKMSSDIQSKFSQDSGLSTKQLTVQANNGVVTLSGTVDNDAQRDAAAKQAASEPGVKTVINNLQIADASTAAGAAPQPAAQEAANSTPEAKPDPGMDSKSDPSPKADASPKPEKPRRERTKPAHKRGQQSDDQQASKNQMAANNPPANSAPAPAPAPADNATPVPPPPPPPRQFIIDQGTQLSVRLVDPIDSEKNQVNDTFHATLNAPLTSDGEQAVPAGVEITGHVVDVKSAGTFAGQSVVVLQLDSLKSGGKTYGLQTDQYRKEGKSRGKNTAEKVGGGAIIGGIIGAIAGGGKGAAIGSAAGAGVGAGAQAASKSQQIKLPSETVLNFTLQAPITVVQAQGSDTGRQKLSDAQ
ncbi:MAG TPA: BON domain-containing protein [Candidatus Sulfotelmatobacter sp.]|nr:BON domain-containing protein [Candidatus Sulfotelmatobacter sp.]